MSSDLQLTRFNPTHMPGILALWSRYFGPWSRDRLIQRWNWQFLSNPFAANLPTPIHVGLLNDRVVGHIAAVPIPLRIQGQPTTVLAATGLVADEAHRWLGFRLVRALLADGPVLATAMSDAARKLLTTSGTAPIPLSRTQHILPRRTSGSLARSIRWRLPAPLCPLVSPRLLHTATIWRKPQGYRPLPHPATPLPPGSDIRPIHRFDTAADALWQRASAPLTFTIERTAQYLNWRYTHMPTQRSIRLGLYENNQLTALAVAILRAKPDRAMLPCVRFGEITELIAHNPSSPAVAHLIAALCARLDRHTPDAITAGPLTPAASAALQRLGFTTHCSDEFEAALCSPGFSPDTFPTPDTTMLTAADGDSLYAFCL